MTDSRKIKADILTPLTPTERKKVKLLSKKEVNFAFKAGVKAKELALEAVGNIALSSTIRYK